MSALPCVGFAGGTVTTEQLSNWAHTHGREAKGGGDLCMVVADSRCCATESNTTLFSNYPPIKN